MPDEPTTTTTPPRPTPTTTSTTTAATASTRLHRLLLPPLHRHPRLSLHPRHRPHHPAAATASGSAATATLRASPARTHEAEADAGTVL